MRLMISEGQNLLEIAANFKIKEEFAKDIKLKVSEHIYIIKCIADLYIKLRDISPLMKDRELGYKFGPAENWEEHKPDKKGDNVTYTLSIENQYKCIDIRLTKTEKYGLYYILFNCLHPKGDIQVPVTQSDLVWPLVRKIKGEKQMLKDLGLVKEYERELVFDEEEKEEALDTEKE